LREGEKGRRGERNKGVIEVRWEEKGLLELVDWMKRQKE